MVVDPIGSCKHHFFTGTLLRPTPEKKLVSTFVDLGFERPDLRGADQVSNSGSGLQLPGGPVAIDVAVPKPYK